MEVETESRPEYRIFNICGVADGDDLWTHGIDSPVTLCFLVRLVISARNIIVSFTSPTKVQAF